MLSSVSALFGFAASAAAFSAAASAFDASIIASTCFGSIRLNSALNGVTA
ncbi:Uncharacterised protein [Vibrio cholerae]|nr:Uncharacterised protein [Vibrio cholerae]